MSLEGSRLGRYQLLKRVGTGGMGEIYLANDTRITRQVALKVLRQKTETSNAASHQDAARMFLREAQAIAMLDHPYILPLFDYGEEELDGKMTAFLVMPFRNEGTLKDWLKRAQAEGNLSAYTVAGMVGQAATALQYAHNRRIIHQDVKPSNFLIRSNPDHPQRPDLLLADFGIARNTGATMILSYNPRGTPIYMAPEQWEGLAYPATDQYALGIMAYEMLTGRPPFQGPQNLLMYAHSQTTPPPPSKYNPRLSTAVDKVILQALAKLPEERYPSIAAFATALQQATAAGEQTAVATHPLTKEHSSGTLQPRENPSGAVITPDLQRTTGTPQFSEPVTPLTPSSSDVRQPVSNWSTGTPLITPNLQQGSSVFYPPLQPVEPAKQEDASPIQHFFRNTRGVLLVGLALLVVLAGGIGGVIYFTSQKPDIKNTPTAVVPTPTIDPITGKVNPYPPHTGTLVMDDPLKDNSKGFSWNVEEIPLVEACLFGGGTYHVKVNFGGLQSCFSKFELNDGVFQARIKSFKGVSAGLILRGSPNSKAYYYFYIKGDSSYGLDLYKADDHSPQATLKRGGSSAIKANQPNLIAIVARGKQLDLYINQQRVASLEDTHASKGFVGLGAESDLTPAEATFDSARAWKL
jgi:serine/threonine protein kinase